MRLFAIRAFSCFGLATALACGDAGSTRATIAKLSADVAEVAAAATGQTALIADEVSTGRHLGFDTGRYPGDGAMRAWREGGSPYVWTGYYLPAPCHPDDGWSGKRETLTAMGYGLAVVYVGQQTWGRTPGAAHYEPVVVSKRVKQRVGRGTTRKTVWRTVTSTVRRRVPPPAPDAMCNADFVTPTRGATDGRDAVARAAAEGFPRGTKIFLDLERMDVVPKSMREYYKAWVGTVLADGRYQPGIYVHTDNANAIYADVKFVYQSVGDLTEPPFWVAKGRGFDLNKLPSDVGHAFAAVWQGVLDVEQTWNGHRIPIDVNVAATRSPSD